MLALFRRDGLLLLVVPVLQERGLKRNLTTVPMNVLLSGLLTRSHLYNIDLHFLPWIWLFTRAEVRSIHLVVLSEGFLEGWSMWLIQILLFYFRLFPLFSTLLLNRLRLLRFFALFVAHFRGLNLICGRVVLIVESTGVFNIDNTGVFVFLLGWILEIWVLVDRTGILSLFGGCDGFLPHLLSPFLLPLPIVVLEFRLHRLIVRLFRLLYLLLPPVVAFLSSHTAHSWLFIKYYELGYTMPGQR